MITTWRRPQSYYDHCPLRGTWAGEGCSILLNQAVHQHDLWQWLCGIPQNVYADVKYGFQRKISVDDDVTVLSIYNRKSFCFI